jgi:eukaryotic-like serine/threonine-protein kinase
MIVAEHTDALSGPADATLNLRISPVVDPSPSHSGTAAVPPALGRFRVLEQVARGGMGVVLRAYDGDLDRELAIKLLSPEIAPDSEAGRQFAQEARVAGQLDHPGILPVYEAGCLPDGRSYFAMPFVRGRTLAALLAERPDPRHGLDYWLGVFEQVCAAVAYAHGRGVVHRDLKPANVMLGPHGQVVVMDWGVAAVRETGSKWGGDAQGYWVFGYMPPEQARGSAAADPRADVFGLGGILCEILTGEPPYVGDDAAAVTRRAAAAEQADLRARLNISGADAQFVALARSCLSPDPTDRPADAGEVARLLGEYLMACECRDRHRGPNSGGGRLRVAGLLTAAAALTAAALAGATARDLHARGARPDVSPPARAAVTPTGSPPPTAPACPPSAASW